MSESRSIIKFYSESQLLGLEQQQDRMSPDQADPEQHKQRASRQFGSPRQQGVDNGTTDVEAGSDLHSTGRKTIHFVILTTTNSYCKKPTSPGQNPIVALIRRHHKGFSMC